MAACVAAGCAWRSTGVEHFLGPVYFRVADASATRALVWQVRRFAIGADGGDRVSLWMGALERTAIASTDQSAASSGSVVWRSPLVWSCDGQPGDWCFSPLFLTVENASRTVFVQTTIIGARLELGAETTGLLIGAERRATVWPEADAMTFVAFDSSHPIDADLAVWASRDFGEGASMPIHQILEVITP